MQGDLWPPVLEDIGLLATITWYCREFKEEHPGISIDQEIALAEEAVPDQARIVIYRVMQEALKNVVKHSGADRVLVSLKPVGAGLEFSIQDNGPGFDLEHLLFRTRLWTGFGLLGLKEKVEHSNGTFEVRSGEGKGTTLSARWSLTGAVDQAAGGRRPFRSPPAEPEEPFRIITENISDWVYAFRMEEDDRIVWEWVTPGFTMVTGHEKDVDLIEILHPDDRAIIAERFHSIKALQPIVNEYRIVTRDGEIRWIRDSINPAADVLHPGRVKVVGAAQDITERKKAEKALESLARFPGENPNPVLRIAVNGGLLYANAAARAWLAEGWRWQADTPLPKLFTALVAKASISGQVVEEEITCPAGRTFWMTAVHPPSENYVTLYGREITLRKQAENEIQQHLEELQGRNEELLRFNQVAVDRELRMIELKRQVNALCALTGQPPKYKLDFDEAQNDVPITTHPI
jgi:PAS domain S-box-containing protein